MAGPGAFEAPPGRSQAGGVHRAAAARGKVPGAAFCGGATLRGGAAFCGGQYSGALRIFRRAWPGRG